MITKPRYTDLVPVEVESQNRTPRDVDRLVREYELPEFQRILPKDVVKMADNIVQTIRYTRARDLDPVTKNNYLANLEDQLESILRIKR